MSAQHPGRRGVSFLIADDLYALCQQRAVEMEMSVGTFARLTLEMHLLSAEQWAARNLEYPQFTRGQQRGHDYPDIDLDEAILDALMPETNR